MKKLITAAMGAAVSLGFALSSAGPAAASTPYGATWVSPVSATVPVSCSFALPSIAIGAVTFIGTSDFDDPDNVPNAGLCNVDFTASWSSVNGLTGGNNGTYSGKMTGKDSNGHNHHLNYKFTPGFTGGSAQTIVGGVFDVDIPASQDDGYGGITYSDTIQLTISYT